LRIEGLGFRRLYGVGFRVQEQCVDHHVDGDNLLMVEGLGLRRD